MRLFLCEKPSQARDIAAVLGDVRRAEGYLEVGTDIVTWCVGHLFAQAEPQDYDIVYQSWALEHLPIIPGDWQLKPVPRVKKQIAVIRNLLGKAAEVVIATDPDREGEVIAREVLDQFRYRGRLKRLLLSALDTVSISKGLADLRDAAKTENLYHAGVGRARADWLVGMNMTRAYTTIGRAQGLEGVLSVGRVQTPTLNLIVTRDAEIVNFTSQTYFTVVAACSPSGGAAQFRANWVPNEQQKSRFCDAKGRCNKPAEARAVAQALTGQVARVIFAKKERKHVRPLLPFNLSGLQQVASRCWGYGAKETLNIAQALYEKHKAITYPRTDSAYLPVDQLGEVPAVTAALAITFAQESFLGAIENADLTLRSKAWDDKKITAHHGMIPTASSVRLAEMSLPERHIFELIARHYVMQFYPDYVYDATTLGLVAVGNQLRASGRQAVTQGWKCLVQPDKEDDTDGPVPWIDEGGQVFIDKAEVAERKTKPPKPYTEGTLILAMTTIANLIEDSEAKAILQENDGIGTEATRGDIIQTLKDRKYVAIQKKAVRSTAKGQSLIAVLPDGLKDPVTTALMERLLGLVAGGELTLADYMAKQEQFVTALVKGAVADSAALVVPAPKRPVKACPECGKALRESTGKYGPFLGCSGFPACKYIAKKGGERPAAVPAEMTSEQCPKCQKPLLRRKSKKGFFLGCSGFPECRHIKFLS